MQRLNLQAGNNRLPLDCQAEGSLVTNSGPGTLSYADSDDQAAADGTLGTGASTTLYGVQYFWANDHTTVSVFPPATSDLAGLNSRVQAVEGSSAAIAARLSLNVRDFSGVDATGATDSTVGINAAILYASGLATSLGMQQITLGGFGRGVFLVDQIKMRQRVALELEEATLVKRVDATEGSTDNAYMIWCPEILLTGNYYGSYPDMAIRGGYLDPNGKVCAYQMVRLMWTENLVVEGLTILDYAPPPPWGVALGCFAFLYGGRDSLVSELTIKGGNALNEDGIHLYHGQNARIAKCHVESGDDRLAIGGQNATLSAQPDPIRNVTFSDVTGRSTHGFAVKVHIDVLSAASIAAGRTVADFGVEGVVGHGVVGTAGVSRNGGIMIVDLNSTVRASNAIKGVDITGINLNVGSTAHDGVATAPGADNPIAFVVSRASDVKLQGRATIIEKTGASATEQLGLCLGYSCENVTFDIDCPELQSAPALETRVTSHVKMRGTVAAGALTGDVVYHRDSTDFDVDATILNVRNGEDGVQAVGIDTVKSSGKVNGKITHAAGATSGYGVQVNATACDHITIGADLSGCAVPVELGQLRASRSVVILPSALGCSDALVNVRHHEDFFGDLIADEWNGRVGSDGACVAPAIVAGAGGTARMTTGAGATTTMAVNGVQLDSALTWQASKSGLRFECRVLSSLVTNLCLCVGLTDQVAALEIPFQGTGAGTWTSTATNAVAFVLDWYQTAVYALGVKADVDATAQNLVATLAAATYVIFAIEVDSAGTARFFINGAPVGTAMANSVTPGTLLTPIVAAFSRAAASRTVDVDYITLEQHR